MAVMLIEAGTLSNVKIFMIESLGLNFLFKVWFLLNYFEYFSSAQVYVLNITIQLIEQILTKHFQIFRFFILFMPVVWKEISYTLTLVNKKIKIRNKQLLYDWLKAKISSRNRSKMVMDMLKSVTSKKNKNRIGSRRLRDFLYIYIYIFVNKNRLFYAPNREETNKNT